MKKGRRAEETPRSLLLFGTGRKNCEMEFLPILSSISLLLCLVLWQGSGEPVEDKEALLDFVFSFFLCVSSFACFFPFV